MEQEPTVSVGPGRAGKPWTRGDQGTETEEQTETELWVGENGL